MEVEKTEARFNGVATRMAILENEAKINKQENENSRVAWTQKSMKDEKLIETLKVENKKLKMENERHMINEKFNIEKKENINSSNLLYSENDKVV